MKISNLSKFREIKKIKKVVSDLEVVLRVSSITTNALNPFQHYIPAKRILSSLNESSFLLKVYIKKYKLKLKDLEKDE